MRQTRVQLPTRWVGGLRETQMAEIPASMFPDFVWEAKNAWEKAGGKESAEIKLVWVPWTHNRNDGTFSPGYVAAKIGCLVQQIVIEM